MKDRPVMELVGVGADAGAIVNKDIFKSRDEWLAELKKLKPTAREFVADATPIVSAAKTLLKSVESARKTVKQPVLDLGRKIDQIADEFSAELQAEVNRVERQVGEAVRKQREEQEARERQLREEQAAILRAEEEKKAELARAATEATRREQERLAELQPQADKAKSPKVKAKLEAEMEKERAAAAAAREQAAMDAEQAEADSTRALQVLAPKIEDNQRGILGGGSQVRGKWVPTVTDVRAAFAANPQIFDVSLSLSKFAAWAKINEVDGKLPSTPGMTYFYESKASIR